MMTETYEAIIAADVRTAMGDDEELFLGLWGELVETQAGFGGDMLWTPRTKGFFAQVFRSYVQGLTEGIVVFGAFDNAVLMWGSAGESPWDSTLGKRAEAWGTYVRPGYQGQGWSKKIREEGKRYLLLMGFESLVGGPLIGNDAGRESWIEFGAEKTQEVYRVRLGAKA
ncbi:hypothetical protein CMI37_35485 [Candidatus Pacearchaeota archaeon]|nr:hypothetical protein [Candidatus Pacearchaeota archaeon]|tara:strand:- start:138 stop:644 length:507 start_codon:yes stop_codon:yes gene_type:complete